MRRALLVYAGVLGALALAVFLLARSETALLFAAARVGTLTHGRVAILLFPAATGGELPAHLKAG